MSKLLLKYYASVKGIFLIRLKTYDMSSHCYDFFLLFHSFAFLSYLSVA